MCLGILALAIQKFGSDTFLIEIPVERFNLFSAPPEYTCFALVTFYDCVMSCP